MCVCVSLLSALSWFQEEEAEAEAEEEEEEEEEEEDGIFDSSYRH